MDFLAGQEHLTTLEWTLRAIIAFIFLIIVARVLGQRAISQLRLIDFVIALVIGNIIAHPLSDPDLGLKGSIVTTIVLVVLYVIGVIGILKYPWLRRLINVEPVTLIENGQINYRGLRKARITLDLLLEELREAKVEDISHVAVAFWEAHGTVSVFQHPEYEAVTPATLSSPPEPFDLPRTIIKEGHIVHKELERFNQSESWLHQQLKSHQAELKDILLATLDTKGNLKLFYYC